MLRKIVDLFTSLKLTIVCLAAGMALIFAGTLAQVHLGIHEAQQRYFQSMLVWWPAEGRGFRIPIFPGGHLIGAVLLVNLIAAHAKRFRWSWRKLGIHLTHAGLIIMLAGGLFTDLFAVESHMRLERGDTKNYSEDQQHMELAIIDTTDGHTIVLTSRVVAPVSLAQLRAAGVDPRAARIIVAKGVVSPRPAYAPISSEVILVDTPGVTANDLRGFEYRRRRRPLFPLEDDAAYP